MDVRIVGAGDVAPLLPAMRADGLDVIPDEGTWYAVEAPGGIAGVARVFERDGHAALDDVWTAPSRRRSGVATAILAHLAAAGPRPLWLICDEPDVAFYGARGFALAPPAALPAPLARHYRDKDEWPAAPDHAHVAMVSEGRGAR